MPFLTRERTPQPTVESTGSKPANAAADADARRLTAAVARGDEAAFRWLYDAYQQRVFRFALVLGRGDEALAQDTAQAVFVTAAAKLRRVESEEHLWNWLARVARQHLAKARRKQQRDSAVIAMADLPECASAEATDAALEECLDAALIELEDGDRRIIEWFYFDQLSHKEIAGQLAATPKAVSSRLERARAKLRSAMARRLSHEA